MTESGDEVIVAAQEPETVAVLMDVSLRSTQYAGHYNDGLELARRGDRSGGGSRLALVSSAIRFTPCVPLWLGAQLANLPPECDEKPED